jgi:hypothetical protein
MSAHKAVAQAACMLGRSQYIHKATHIGQGMDVPRSAKGAEPNVTKWLWDSPRATSADSPAKPRSGSSTSCIHTHACARAEGRQRCDGPMQHPGAAIV